MLLYLMILLINSIELNSFILKENSQVDSYKSKIYNIGNILNINNKHQPKGFDFNKNVSDGRKPSKEHNIKRTGKDMAKYNRNWLRELAASTVNTYRNHNIDEETATVVAVTSKGKRNILKDKNIRFSTEDSMNYDYNNLVNEYDAESISEAKSNNTYHVAKIDTSETSILNSFISFKVVNSLVKDYQTQKLSPKTLSTRFWKIMRTWMIVYIFVAIPLWCTRGWCCCCLFCKFFKPQKTIDEAKKYLMLNPPGVLITNAVVMHYTPTEKERDSYEKFEHLIKTM